MLETCGQITKENEIRLDLIELYRAKKKPIEESGLHPSSKWRQVISKDMAQINENQKGRLETVHTQRQTRENTKGSGTQVHFKGKLGQAVSVLYTRQH